MSVTFKVYDNRVEPESDKALILIVNDHGDVYSAAGGSAEQIGGSMTIGGLNCYAYRVKKGESITINGIDAGIQSSNGSYIDGTSATIPNPFTADGDFYIYTAWH